MAKDAAEVSDELTNPTGLTDREVKSLPVWAQDRLIDLRRAKESAEAKYKDQFDSQEVTRVTYGDVFNNARYLPDDGYARVRVGVTDLEGKEARVDICRRTDRTDGTGPEYVEISTSGSVFVMPQASNVLRIYSRGK